MRHLIKNMVYSIWDNKVHFFSLILLFLISLSTTWGIFSANLSFKETLSNWNNISNSSDAVLDLNASTSFSHKKVKDELEFLPKFLDDLDKLSQKFKDYRVKITYRDYRSFYDKKNNKKALFLPYEEDGKKNDYYVNNDVDKIFFNHQINCDYQNDQCIYLATEYALKNHIKVGDILDFNSFFSTNNKKSDDKYKFKVIGYANSYDLSYPKIDQIDTVPQTKNSEICYINQKFLLTDTQDNLETLSYSDRDQTVLFHFEAEQSSNLTKKDFSKEFYDNAIKQVWTDQKDTVATPNTFSFKTLGYYDKYNDEFKSNNLWYERTTTFEYFVNYETKISIIFLFAINFAIFFVVAIIARKRIDVDENNILIFKSLGFKKSSITFVYSFYPFIFTILLSLFALGISFFFQRLLFSLFNNFFMVPITKISFSWITFAIDICYYALFISFFTFLSVYFLIRKKMAKSI